MDCEAAVLSVYGYPPVSEIAALWLLGFGSVLAPWSLAWAVSVFKRLLAASASAT